MATSATVPFEIRLLAPLDVVYGGPFPAEHVMDNTLPGEGLKGERRHEFSGAFCHCHLDQDIIFHQEPHQLC